MKTSWCSVALQAHPLIEDDRNVGLLWAQPGSGAGQVAAPGHPRGLGHQICGDVDQDSFHASLLIVEPAKQPELAAAYDCQTSVGNWIVTEDQQGFVTLDQYPTPYAARQALTDLPDLDVPSEDDGTITPAGPLGSHYAVAFGGRFLGYATDIDQATAILQAAMEFVPDNSIGASAAWDGHASASTTSATPTPPCATGRRAPQVVSERLATPP